MTKNMKQLIEYDTENVWHILPIGDLAEHTDKDLICVCSPRIELQPNQSLIVVHNSFDGREYKEIDNVKFRKQA